MTGECNWCKKPCPMVVHWKRFCSKECRAKFHKAERRQALAKWREDGQIVSVDERNVDNSRQDASEDAGGHSDT